MLSVELAQRVVKINGDTLCTISTIIYKGDVYDFLFNFLHAKTHSVKGSTLKGKSLFPSGANGMQILSFLSPDVSQRGL